ncbi:MAG: hypothetical protein ACI9QD_000897 [Thermoproteota archaeon]
MLQSKKSLQAKDKTELVDMLLEYQGSSIHTMRKALDKQLESIAIQVNSLDIDITEDSDQKLLDLVIKFSDKGKKIAESMIYMSDGKDKNESEDEFNYEDMILNNG